MHSYIRGFWQVEVHSARWNHYYFMQWIVVDYISCRLVYFNIIVFKCVDRIFILVLLVLKCLKCVHFS